ncbi:MAG: hypothetical protein ABFS28_02465 [Bacteroidota bacterium]
MKSKLTLLILLLFIGLTAGIAQDTPPADTVTQDQITEAQEAANQSHAPKQKRSISDKLYFGGYVNMSFGRYTVIGIEPMVGYKLIPRLSVGAKIRYDYIQDKRYTETYTASNYGGSVFTRLVLFRGLYAHAEYAGYNYKNYTDLGGSTREWVPFMLVGAGYNLRVGRRTSVNAQVLFDVLQSDKSPYRRWEPFYSVGVGVGF